MRFSRRRPQASELEQLRKVIASANDGGLASRVAEVYSEEIVRLRGQMQQALDALSASPYQGAWNEAKARKILRDALKYEGWLRDVIKSPSGGGEAA